jgi:mono/diheme cytochrome c family protein
MLRPLAFAALAAASLAAAPYTPPRETATLPPGEGAQRATLYCIACHSADYITIQPRGQSQAFWEASVTKMIRVYGAAIPETEVKAIAAYLTAATAAKPAGKP